MIGEKTLWCQRCGSIRRIFQTGWKIPLDRVGDIARSVLIPEEEPTKPGTPGAKGKR
jgi:hypothetical protein